MQPTRTPTLPLDGLDEALDEATRRQVTRQRRTRIGWRQVTAQLLYVLAAIAFVGALLWGGDR